MATKQAYIEAMMENAEIDRGEAQHVFDIYAEKKHGVMRWTANGGWSVVHGLYLDRDAIESTLALHPIESDPCKECSDRYTDNNGVLDVDCELCPYNV